MKPKPTRQNYQQPELIALRDIPDDSILTETIAAAAKLVAAQKNLPGPKPGESMSNAQFADKYVGMDGSTWGRVQSALLEGKSTYTPKDWRPTLQKLRGAMAVLRVDADGSAPEITAQPVVGAPLEFKSYVTVRHMIDSAFNNERNRIIPVIGDTGAGKTKLRRHLEFKYPVKIISLKASKPWHGRYTAMWKDLAKALNLQKPPRGAWDLQEKVVGMLNKEPKVIVIDECQYVASDAIDGIKYVCENTACVILMLTTPEQWKHVKDDDWDNVDQLRNRIYGQYDLCKDATGKNTLDLKDVASYVQAALPQFDECSASDRSSICAILATAGEHFGLWNKVSSIVEQVVEVAGQPENLQPIGPSSFIAAQTVLAKMKRF